MAWLMYVFILWRQYSKNSESLKLRESIHDIQHISFYLPMQPLKFEILHVLSPSEALCFLGANQLDRSSAHAI
jgi:hypothetical protein